MWRLALFLVVAAAAWGCTEPTTIELIVEGDLEPGIHVDKLSLAMWDDGAQTWSATRVLSAASGLPLVYTLEPPTGGGLSAELSVDAIRQEQRILATRRAISFVSGQSVQVRICLWENCIGRDAPDCFEGRCDPPETDADADADTDTDADWDADTNGDADTAMDTGADGGADTGSDSDLHADAIADADGDGGPDGGRDGAADGDLDASADADLDAAVDGDSSLDGGVDDLVPGDWVTIPGGSFNMGAMPGELGSHPDETLHRVNLTRDFRLQTTEVSLTDFAVVMGYVPPPYTGCTECPVDSVTWQEAAAYTNELSSLAGIEVCYTCTGAGDTLECELSADHASPYECAGYRLPTESEWERAARAGTTEATYNGNLDDDSCASDVLDPIAWYCGNSSDMSHAGGALLPNDFGLYDMLGNVAEWCHDHYVGYPLGPVDDPWGAEEDWSSPVYRGGSFYTPSSFVRAAARSGDPFFSWDRGFRPARSLAP